MIYSHLVNSLTPCFPQTYPQIVENLLIKLWFTWDLLSVSIDLGGLWINVWIIFFCHRHMRTQAAFK